MAWRRDEDGTALAPSVTDAGLRAIRLEQEDDAATDRLSGDGRSTAEAGTNQVPGDGKQAATPPRCKRRIASHAACATRRSG